MPDIHSIAVLGAGAVGGYFGGQLARTGRHVAFIARGEHLRVLRDAGLRIDPLDGEPMIIPVQAHEDPAEVGPVDLVLFAVKTRDLPAAAERLHPLVGGSTTILPLQNGVEAPAQLAEIFGTDRVLGGTCKIICERVAPGHLQHRGAIPTIALGERSDEPSPRVEAIAAALRGAGIRVEQPDSIHAAIWTKFVFFAPVSSMGAARDETLGQLMSTPQSRETLRTAMQEVRQVAVARGVTLPESLVDDALAFLDTLPFASTSSMQRDIAAGRPSELEAITGAVVRLGRQAGVPVPTHESWLARLRPREARASGRG